MVMAPPWRSSMMRRATDEFLSGVADFLLWYGKDRDRTKYRSRSTP
jgi:hypothetical protein